ncbi:MAG: hypothetical protein JRD68_11880 [Deltaproteobacteria bacterium]|nr:hypothetical protein [Deltaproteobacteria bacterium]
MNRPLLRRIFDLSAVTDNNTASAAIDQARSPGSPEKAVSMKHPPPDPPVFTPVPSVEAAAPLESSKARTPIIPKSTG